VLGFGKAAAHRSCDRANQKSIEKDQPGAAQRSSRTMAYLNKGPEDTRLNECASYSPRSKLSDSIW